MVKDMLYFCEQIFIWIAIVLGAYGVILNRNEYKHLVKLSARTEALNSELETLTKKMKFALNPLDMIQKDWPQKVANDKR